MHSGIAADHTAEYRRIKSSLHVKILEEIDLERLDRMQPEQARNQIRNMVSARLENDNTPLAFTERRKIIDEILDELFGLGPLEPLLLDSQISDILVNGYSSVYIERQGRLEKTDIRFDDDDHLMRIIDRIVSRVGRRVDESSPMVDARLADGSRVNAIIPPLALDGPMLSIRRFGA